VPCGIRYMVMLTDALVSTIRKGVADSIQRLLFLIALLAGTI